MKKRRVILGIALVLVLLTIVDSSLGCTIFSQKIGETVLFGNNEDYFLTGTYVWFEPSQDNRYGAAYFGYNHNNDSADGYPQGGMNDQGLACDANGLPVVPLNNHPEKPGAYSPMERILQECSTVNETISWCQNHNFGSSFSGQIHFADAFGEAVVVSGGPDRELAFTRKNNKSFLVSTNFNLANPDNGWYPCWRYDTAEPMLEAIEQKGNLTVQDFREILDAVHQEGKYATKYSNIFDLKTREIYIYYNHNFDQVIKLKLEEELLKGYHEYRIADLFSGSSTTSENSSSDTIVYGKGFMFIILAPCVLLIIKKKKS